MTIEAARSCEDAILGYGREAWHPESEAGLSFDVQYRLAHLPLIAPDHPLTITAVPGRDYRMGRHPPRTSLVIEVDDAALQAAPSFVELIQAVVETRLARKICWSLLERRRGRLHATVAGALTEADVSRCTTGPGGLALADLGPVSVELRGLFVGRINRGRIYLRAYPECRNGRPAVAAVHDVLGRPPSDIFLVGLFNLLEELDCEEAKELHRLIDAWWNRPILAMTATRLAMLRASDDLVLDSEIVGSVEFDASRT